MAKVGNDTADIDLEQQNVQALKGGEGEKATTIYE